MYHCCIHFSLVSNMIHKDNLLETIKKMPPLENFSHEFCQGSDCKSSQIAEADAIFVNLRGMEPDRVVEDILREKKKDARLILLAEREQILLLSEFLPEIEDIWTLPMEKEELEFRFFKWQGGIKLNRDYRQTSHFLETAINSVPNLVWLDRKSVV